MEFTTEQQQYIDELLQAEQQKVVDIQSQLDTLQQSQQTKDDELLQLQTQLFQQKVDSTLKDANLLEFKDVINVSNEDELNAVIEKLSNAVSSTQADFEPSKKRYTSAYDYAKQTGDNIGMLKSIFGFKN